VRVVIEESVGPVRFGEVGLYRAST
jgi:hypothetical protein